MKIYFVAYNIYGMGGTVRTTVNTANYLADNGYSVEIISLKRTSRNPLFKINKFVKLTPILDARGGCLYSKNINILKKIIKKFLLSIPSIFMDRDEDLYKMFSLFSDIKLINILRKIESGIVITTIPSFNILATKILKKNVIIVGQEHKPYDSHSKRLMRKIKKYYPKLDALTCLTERDYSYYKSINENTVRIENGVKMQLNSAKLENKIIISAGRFVDIKGYDLLLMAFKGVVKKHPDWKLNIFGDGPEKEKLKKIIVEQELYNNVRLMQTSNNLNKEILTSSIYVLSSLYESFGMVIVESMALGVPCISYATEGPREIVTDGEDGILVSPIGNVEALEKAINNLIEDDEFRIEMGSKAKKKSEKYSLDLIGEKWEEMIRNLLR